MRLYEKIILTIFAVSFGLQLIDFEGKSELFVFSTLLLSLSYLFGGYWLFNTKGNKNITLSIIAGAALSTSILFLPNLIWLTQNYYYIFLPIANGLLFISLGVYLFRKRKSETSLYNIKSIFIRSLIVLIVTSFFTYTPISFKPYRKILYALNTGPGYIQQNIRVFDYIEECEDALEKGNCDRAIEYALKANKAGKLWLEIEDDSNSDKANGVLKGLQIDSINLPANISNSLESLSNESELWKISATFSNLYRAYKCKADAEYYKNKFEDALANYNIAHAYLSACDHKSKYWDEEKSWSLDNIAKCYMSLRKFSLADSVLVRALENYKTVNNSADKGLAKLFSHLALSFSGELQFSNSNVMFQAANSILSNDTLDKDNRRVLFLNYNKLIRNHLTQDSLENALFFIEKASYFSEDRQELTDYCQFTLHNGIYYLKLNEYHKADSILKNCLQCYESQPINNTQDIAECNLLLGNVSIALAKYDDARKYLEKGTAITRKNFGSNNSRYATHLMVLAYLNKIGGDYTTSGKQYNTVVQIYSSEFGKRSNNLPTALSELADLDIKLSNLNSAKKHSDSSLSIASVYSTLTSPSTSDLLNTAAYVNYFLGHYKFADTLYKKVIKNSTRFGLQTDAATAIALNGLGLIETSKRNYYKADSLFKQSLKLHQIIFSDNHPLTATVYLNFGRLLIQEGKLIDAEEKINKALQIDKQFFKSEHDIFADIFVALGDLSKKNKQNDVAKDYYKKALDIYQKKFDKKHWKIVATRQKIK
jgi:Tfp pilus assembly protein PilF